MFDFIAQAAEPVITGLDVVKTVDAFYQDAWLKLIGVLVFFGALIGVVMPLIIQRIQSSSFDKTEKRLKDEIEQIKNETQGSIQEEVKALTSKFDEIQKNMEKRLDEETRLTRAEFYREMGASLTMDVGQEIGTFIFRIISAREYATLKKYDFVAEQLNQAISKKDRIFVVTGKGRAEAEEIVETIRAMCSGYVDELSKILEDQGVINRYSELLAKVYDFCKNCIIAADKPETPEEPK